MPVGHQLFTEPSFFEDTDQVLAELTCELDEKFLQLSSEGTPREHLIFPRTWKQISENCFVLSYVDLDFKVLRKVEKNWRFLMSTRNYL